MAPPSNLPRLADIDPAQLGTEVEQRFRDHLHSQAMALGLGAIRIEEQEGRQPGESDLGLSVRWLAQYARSGGTLDASVHEYLISLIPLWSSAEGHAPTDLEGEADLSTPLGVVMAAALARERIAEGRAVPVRWLAALAGLSRTQLYKLHEGGELGIDDAEVAAKEAKRWLSGRGVAGFASPAARPR